MKQLNRYVTKTLFFPYNHRKG